MGRVRAWVPAVLRKEAMGTGNTIKGLLILGCMKSYQAAWQLDSDRCPQSPSNSMRGDYFTVPGGSLGDRNPAATSCSLGQS